MSVSLRLETRTVSNTVTLEEGPFADALLDELPLESRASTWGSEIYFPISVKQSPGARTRDVSIGDVAYWPDGTALALFYGPTPLSDGQQPVPADPVELVGTVSNPDQLDRIEAGDPVSLSDHTPSG